MKTFFLKYIKEILLVVLTLLIVFLLYLIFKPTNDKSELLQYKLEQLDNSINSLKLDQKRLTDSIVSYKNDINKIDGKLEVIKNKKSTVNNFYSEKNGEIENSTNKQLDSLFRKRYNY